MFLFKKPCVALALALGLASAAPALAARTEAAVAPAHQQQFYDNPWNWPGNDNPQGGGELALLQLSAVQAVPRQLSPHPYCSTNPYSPYFNMGGCGGGE